MITSDAISLPHASQFGCGLRANSSKYGPGDTRSIMDTFPPVYGNDPELEQKSQFG